MFIHIQSRIIIQIQTQLNHLAWMLIQLNVSRMQMLRRIVMLGYFIPYKMYIC